MQIFKTLSSKLNDRFLMIRNYVKQPIEIFTRIAAKVTALNSSNRYECQ